LKLTLWFVGLIALAALVYFVQHLRERRRDRHHREQSSLRHRESRAAADRRDCLELAKSLTGTAPAEPDDKLAPAAVARPEIARRFRGSEAPQGFDPDLPARPARPSRG
jgi:hypothetical protein